MTDVGVWVLGALTVIGAGIFLAWGRPTGAAEVVVLADVDAALLVSAAALRRLGARITRYDTDEHTLEARTPAAGEPVVRVRAQPDGEQATRLLIESDARGRRRLIRRFRAELARGA